MGTASQIIPANVINRVLNIRVGQVVGTAFTVEVDQRSDVFALACVLYEMLAGEPPFSAPTAQAVLVRILTTEAPSTALPDDQRPNGTLGSCPWVRRRYHRVACLERFGA